MFTEKRSYIGGIQKNAPSLISNGSGDIHLTCNIDGDTECTITLMDVAFCPDAHDNLISESRMDRKGLEIRKWNGQVRILRKNGSVLMQGYLQRNLYELDCYATPHTSQSDFAFTAKYTQSLDLWHRCLAHISGDALKTQPCYRNGPIHQWGSQTMRWMHEGKTSPDTFPEEIPKPS